MTTPQLIDTTFIAESRGSLLAVEQFREVPFDVARAFVVMGVPAEQERGVHAHHACEQFLICIQGSLSAVADTGHDRQIFELNSPKRGLYLPALTWGTQFNHSSDAILLVLASAAFDADDYIHDYDEFRIEVSKRKPE